MTKKEIAKKLDIMFECSLSDLERNVKKGRSYCAEVSRHDLSTLIRVASMLGLIDEEQFDNLNKGIWQIYYYAN